MFSQLLAENSMLATRCALYDSSNTRSICLSNRTGTCMGTPSSLSPSLGTHSTSL